MSYSGDPQRVRRHGAENISIAIGIRLAGAPDRAHLALDGSGIHLEQDRGVELQHAGHIDEACAIRGRRPEASEKAAICAGDISE